MPNHILSWPERHPKELNYAPPYKRHLCLRVQDRGLIKPGQIRLVWFQGYFICAQIIKTEPSMRFSVIKILDKLNTPVPSWRLAERSPLETVNNQVTVYGFCISHEITIECFKKYAPIAVEYKRHEDNPSHIIEQWTNHMAAKQLHMLGLNLYYKTAGQTTDTDETYTYD